MMLYDGPTEHCEAIVHRTGNHIRRKYGPGHSQHGGRLWKKPVLKMLGDEITDLNTYYDVLHEQHTEALAWLEAALLGNNNSGRLNAVWDAVRKARNILRYGNEEGIDEPDS